jgi:hypothetical protein
MDIVQESDDEIRIRKIIENNGFHLACFDETDYLPGFGYTIGLWKNFNHPEIICIGLSGEIVWEILKVAVHKISQGIKIVTGIQYVDFSKESPVQFIQVHQSNISDYMGYCKWYNEYKPFEVLQLIWPDTNNKFPWEKDFDTTYRIQQPILDKELDFKFYTDPSHIVVTTKEFIDGVKPINYVAHTSDAGWQFLTNPNVEQEDISFITFSSIVKMDPSLNELFDLDKGEYAEKDVDGDWIRGYFE